MVKIIFFKAKTAIKNKWLNSLIAWKTDGPYSHCEIYFNRSRQSFSADAEYNKCHFKIRNLNFDQWDIVELDVDDYETYLACKEFENHYYDWMGIIFNFLIPINIQHRSKFFCSELIVRILQLVRYDKVMGMRAHKIDPNKLYRILTNGKSYV